MASGASDEIGVEGRFFTDPSEAIEEFNEEQPFSPFSSSSGQVPAQPKKRRKKSTLQSTGDLLLLQATEALKPFNATKRNMKSIWETVAARVNESGSMRNHKYCVDRVRELLRQYKTKKNVTDPTGDGQQPEPTEEENLLHNIEASEEGSKPMTEVQKEKATEDQELIDKLEQDTLKAFSKKSRVVDLLNSVSDDEWKDAEMEAGADSVVFTTSTKNKAKIQNKQSPWRKTPKSARRGRDDLFREKFKVDAEIRREELKDRKAERGFQREKLIADQLDKEEERKLQREKEERADEIRREEISVLKQNSDMLREIVLSVVKKN